MSWSTCAVEGQFCSFSSIAKVRYGANGVYSTKILTGGVTCSNEVFGDPVPGVNKACEYLPDTIAPACNDSESFCASYYNNMDFTDFIGMTTEPFPIDHIWADGSPYPAVDADTFSAYYRGSFFFAGGAYNFTTTADDGVRVLVDGVPVIDQYIDQAPTTYIQTVNLEAGAHLVEVFYYENLGGAQIQLSW